MPATTKGGEPQQKQISSRRNNKIRNADNKNADNIISKGGIGNESGGDKQNMGGGSWALLAAIAVQGCDDPVGSGLHAYWQCALLAMSRRAFTCGGNK